MDLSSRLAALPESERRLLYAAGTAGRIAGAPVYWVGGGVRDLLLGRRARPDVDLVVEGDLDTFTGAFAAEAGARETWRSLFLTRELELDGPGRARIDVARARRETYDGPAALPRVEPADLAADLRRRDFTVNSLAIPLHPDLGRRVVDVSGGLDDLRLRSLRVHHSRSFVDDPTRLLRAVEFESRLGFRLESGTERLLGSALEEAALEPLGPARLRVAALRAFGRRETAAAAWRRAEDLGLPAAIHPALAVARWPESNLARALARLGRDEAGDAPSAETLVFGLAVRLLDSTEETREEVADRLDLDSRSSWALVLGPTRVAAIAGDLAEERTPSEAHRRLRELSMVELALLADRGGAAEDWVERELREMRPLRLSIDGRALLAHGVPAGPRLGAALDRTLAARLDGRIGAAEELGFALAAARVEGAP
jgi:tRNA nucleotidyltransferase (CCA-adding enzyme)